MRFLSFSLIVIIFSCHTVQNGNEVNSVASLLPHDTVINIDYEGYNSCTTFYYSAKDTTNPILSRIIYYDKSGKEKSTTYISFEAYVPSIKLNMYDKDGRETAEYYRINEKDTKPSLEKQVFQYDGFGRIIKTIVFDFKRRIKKGIVRGLGTSGGCIITDDDYEKEKSWALKSIWNNMYDRKGRLVKKLQSYPEHASQNTYLYKYDAQSRLTEERSLSDGHLIYVDNYLYYQRGYEHSLILFDKSGARAKKWDGGLESIDTFRYKLDRFDNILEEKVIEEGGRQASRDRNYYDEKNRIIKKEIYDEGDKLLGFYIHLYDTSLKPHRKNLFMNND